MKIAHSRPPNYDRVVAVFPFATNPGVIFTYGNVIYIPDGSSISKPLQIHEQVHCDRQGSDPAGWWEQYLVSPEFRLQEELPAHRAEWRAYVKRHGPAPRMLATIAGRLSGPLYGGIVGPSEARRLIVERESECFTENQTASHV